jgi:hypothetical protein
VGFQSGQMMTDMATVGGDAAGGVAEEEAAAVIIFHTLNGEFNQLRATPDEEKGAAGRLVHTGCSRGQDKPPCARGSRGRPDQSLPASGEQAECAAGPLDPSDIHDMATKARHAACFSRRRRYAAGCKGLSSR